MSNIDRQTDRRTGHISYVWSIETGALLRKMHTSGTLQRTMSLI